MALTLPNTSVLNRQLSKAGLAAKASGPSLFSPLQSPGPTAPQQTSMQLDRNATRVGTSTLAPLTDRSGYGLGRDAMTQRSTASLFPGGSVASGSNPFAPQSGGSGSVGAFSGDQSMLNTYDAAFQAAGARYGIDPNWIKSIAAIEGHYDNSVDQYGAVGIMGIMPGGYPALEAMYPGWQSDPGQNIALGAAILAEKIRANGGTIEGGIQGYLGWGTDAYGTTPGSYLQRAQQYYNQLSQNGGQFGSVAPINGMWGGNPTGNAFVQAALQYQGVDYNWGAIPGANQDPWQTGWDTVHENTAVLMANGSTKKIKKVEPGDLVMTYTPDGPVPVSVKMVYKKGVRDMIRIETTRTIHRTTPNHPFLAYDSKLRTHFMPNASDLNVMDMLVAARPPLDESPHPDVAWVVGLMIGNGNINGRTINLCVYGEIRERASAILARVTKSKPGHDDKHGIFISASGFAQSLRAMGLGVHAHEKRVPDVVWRWPDEARAAFLLGYLQTDGSLCDGCSYSVASASQELMLGIRDLAASLGHKVSGYRKQERTKEIWIKGKVVKNARPIYWSRIRLNPKDTPYPWDLVTVISVESDDPAPAFDLSIDHPSETFIADGVVVHNCSGFTYFMDQKYGNGSLPMGSHYQYQYAQTTGQLFTDLAQLQPGDLVFIDTGWQGGAGAELNRAGHVGIYIGNGQMIHAANENVGTIISPLSGYGGILGAMHQGGGGGAVGGSAYAPSASGGTAAQRFMQLLRGYQAR